MTAATTNPFEWLIGSFADDKGINQRLEWARVNCFLISPASTCRLPPGYSVGFNLEKIDPESETHDVGHGKRSLLGGALHKLGNAAGITVVSSTQIWDENEPRHPYYVHWKTTVARPTFRIGDYTIKDGDSRIDLRDGTAQVTKILDSVRGDAPTERAEKGRVQLRDTRAKLLEHAQTKSELRAIRNVLALRTYTTAELAQKPFVVALMSYDGHDDDDPDMERENKRAIRGVALSGARALFGAAPVSRQLIAPTAAPRQLTQATDAIYDDTSSPEIDSDGVIHDSQPPPAQAAAAPVASPAPVAQSAQQAAPPPPAAAPPPPPPPAATTAGGHSGARSGLTIPGGREKGSALEDASEESLSYWLQKKRAEMPTCEARFVRKNEEWIAAADAELTRRAGGPMPASW